MVGWSRPAGRGRPVASDPTVDPEAEAKVFYRLNAIGINPFAARLLCESFREAYRANKKKLFEAGMDASVVDRPVTFVMHGVEVTVKWPDPVSGPLPPAAAPPEEADSEGGQPD